jgi:hypothetical protein
VNDRNIKQALSGDGHKWEGECERRGCREVNMVKVLYTPLRKQNRKPPEIVLRRGWEMRRSDRGGEFNQSPLHAYMEYHYETPLYS